jgi:hypothetical protein
MQIVSSEFVSTFGQPRAVRLYIAGYSFEFIASFVDPHLFMSPFLSAKSYGISNIDFRQTGTLLQSSYFDSCVIAFTSFFKEYAKAHQNNNI